MFFLMMISMFVSDFTRAGDQVDFSTDQDPDLRKKRSKN